MSKVMDRLHEESNKKPNVNFTFAVKPSGSYANHVLVLVDSTTGEVGFGEPLRPDELASVTDGRWPAALNANNMTQLVTVLLHELIVLRNRVAELEAKKVKTEPIKPAGRVTRFPGAAPQRPLRALAVCAGGNVRSVAMAYALKQRGLDALAIGWQFAAPDTLEGLCEWADLVVVMEASFVAKISSRFAAKISAVDVGPDVWGNPYHPELQTIVKHAAFAWAAVGFEQINYGPGRRDLGAPVPWAPRPAFSVRAEPIEGAEPYDAETIARAKEVFQPILDQAVHDLKGDLTIAARREVVARVQEQTRVEANRQAETDAAETVRNLFHHQYYAAASEGKTWADTRWFGVPVLKLPLDLWLYQEILFATRPEVIVECGTANGGSALWFAHMLDLLAAHVGGDYDPEVVTIDINGGPPTAPEVFRWNATRPLHPRIKYVCGSSTDPKIVEAVHEHVGKRRALVVLDSDHSRDHVLAEMLAYQDLVPVDGYMLVEDGNIAGNPVYTGSGVGSEGGDPGPAAAIEAFFKEPESADFRVDAALETKFLMSFNFCGYLKRIKEASRAK